jgi:hypothetical protein
MKSKRNAENVFGYVGTVVLRNLKRRNLSCAFCM